MASTATKKSTIKKPTDRKPSTKKGAATKKSSTKSQASNYTKPDLREKVKDEVMKSDKGGKPGQWSARKAQMVASEYKKEGGGYTTAKKSGSTATQKHLQDWTKQDWRTVDGKKAGKPDGKTDRYLPAEAWQKLTPAQRKETRAKKLKASVERQFVNNAPAAKKAGASARTSTSSKTGASKSGTSKTGPAKSKPKGREPLEGYSDMTVAQITKQVKDLDKRKLRSVKSYEEKNAARKGVLSAIDKKLDS